MKISKLIAIEFFWELITYYIINLIILLHNLISEARDINLFLITTPYLNTDLNQKAYNKI